MFYKPTSITGGHNLVGEPRKISMVHVHHVPAALDLPRGRIPGSWDPGAGEPEHDGTLEPDPFLGPSEQSLI